MTTIGSVLYETTTTTPFARCLAGYARISQRTSTQHMSMTSAIGVTMSGKAREENHHGPPYIVSQTRPKPLLFIVLSKKVDCGVGWRC